MNNQLLPTPSPQCPLCWSVFFGQISRQESAGMELSAQHHTPFLAHCLVAIVISHFIIEKKKVANSESFVSLKLRENINLTTLTPERRLANHHPCSHGSRVRFSRSRFQIPANSSSGHVPSAHRARACYLQPLIFRCSPFIHPRHLVQFSFPGASVRSHTQTKTRDLVVEQKSSWVPHPFHCKSHIIPTAVSN
jgi:hypothetical protein